MCSGNTEKGGGPAEPRATGAVTVAEAEEANRSCITQALAGNCFCLSICVLPKFLCWDLNAQCDSIRM